MITTTRPEIVDEGGTHHRYGCPADAWENGPASNSGWTWVQCAHCGAQQLRSGVAYARSVSAQSE